jgi:hypothetical protein
MALHAAALVLGLAALARPQAAAVSQPAIDAAIERGVAHLLSLYSDGEGRDVAPLAPRLTLVDRPGLRALTVYALLKSGVDRRHPVVEKLCERLAYERFDRTYDAACMLLALSALDPAGHRAWIGELSSQLLAGRAKTGEFSYPSDDGDLSNTQFAALALRAAAAAGVEIAPDAWIGIAQAVLRHQTHEGGFAYLAGSRRHTGSMTVAGVGILALCAAELERAGALAPPFGEQLHRARSDGVRWLARHFAVDHNPEYGAWTHYYLYGLERMGALSGLERIGDHDWYREGAAFLVASQLGNGSWAGTFEREPTLFALLFLCRATATSPPRTHAPRTHAMGEHLARGTSVSQSVQFGSEGGPLRPNLLVDAHPKASASSVLADASGRSPIGFAARCAVDGNPRSPWIATANDDSPVLRITLPSSRRANRVGVAPAILFPRSPDFLTRPIAVAIRVNGGPSQEVPFRSDADASVEIRLEKSMDVGSVELRLIGREVAGRAVGIGEVVLWLAPD